MSTLLPMLVRTLRLPMLALLVLAVLANPVLASVGDTHGLAHAPAMDAAIEADAHAQGHDGHDDAGELLHALMHSAHGGGHLAAVPVRFAWVLPAAPAQGVADTARALPLAAPTPTPLRPPITA